MTETLTLFPTDDLLVIPTPAAPVEDEPEPAPLLAAIPGQLDLFTGLDAS